ncbi:MAG TPA: hypothetical protein PKC79_15465 [Solidesulfovibrio magneticus]|nr:hypothetical protein [Solidesulfovibrio magneticus]
MDDIVDRLYAVLLSFLGKVADVFVELLDAAGRKALEIGAGLAGRLEAVGAKLAAVPLWVSLPLAVLCLGAVAAYFLRQRLYDRVLVYHLVWLTRRGFARRRFVARRGASREEREYMARAVPLPERFGEVAIFEVHPDKYLTLFGPVGDTAEGMRLYRRDLRSGLYAMGSDIIQAYRANQRMLHADGELRALFAVLDAADPVFAANRPRLPGEGPAGKGAGRSIRVASTKNAGDVSSLTG